MLGKENGFCYAVSVLRKSTGRGKSRKAGGLTTLELPDQLEAFESAEVLTPVPIQYTCSFPAFDDHFSLHKYIWQIILLSIQHNSSF